MFLLHVSIVNSQAEAVVPTDFVFKDIYTTAGCVA
jgi:hypothetical protein